MIHGNNEGRDNGQDQGAHDLDKETKLDYVTQGYGLWLCLCMCTALGPIKMNSPPDHCLGN
jgi:hypothetical protein